ncbi:MAG: hypothetical protein OXN18_15560 [Gemmatimonadota bacterium]|nr:hypothetical protein [Gemmatimonadota bacterium]
MSNRFAQALGKKPSPQQQQAPAKSSKKRGKHIGGYFTPEVSRQLRQVALDENSSVQALLGEALDLLFESRRLPAIAGRLKAG